MLRLFIKNRSQHYQFRFPFNKTVLYKHYSELVVLFPCAKHRRNLRFKRLVKVSQTFYATSQAGSQFRILREGLTIFCGHTSASLTLQKYADPDVQRDIQTFLRNSSPKTHPFIATSLKGETTCPRICNPP